MFHDRIIDYDKIVNTLSIKWKMSKHVVLASCKGVLPNLFTRVKSAPTSNNFLTPLIHLLETHQCSGLFLKIWNIKYYTVNILKNIKI